MISFTSDSSQATNLINSMVTNVQNLDKFFAVQGKKRLKDSNKNSFIKQRSPDNTPFEISHLSQVDPTGSPRKTMMRSRDLFDDTQNDSNYVMNGMTLQEFTTAQSEKGFLYGEYHNTKDSRSGSGRWWFAGLDIENLNLLTVDAVEWIMKGN